MSLTTFTYILHVYAIILIWQASQCYNKTILNWERTYCLHESFTIKAHIDDKLLLFLYSITVWFLYNVLLSLAKLEYSVSCTDICFNNCLQCVMDLERETLLIPCQSMPPTLTPLKTAQKSVVTSLSSTHQFMGKSRTWTALQPSWPSISTAIDYLYSRTFLLFLGIHTPKHQRWTLPSLMCLRQLKKLLVRLRKTWVMHYTLNTH